MQYLFIRDFISGTTTKRISLVDHYPICMSLIETNKINFNGNKYEIDEVKKLIPSFSKPGNYFCAIGTKEGKVLIYNLSSMYHTRLFKTKAGMSYGAVTALDIQSNAEFMVAATESGELLQFNLMETIDKVSRDQ